MENIEFPKVNIADEDSKEDFAVAVDENDNSEETVDYTIIDSIKNIHSGKWQSMSYGIDVSSHNGYIDWKRVANAGVEFAMICC